MLGVRRMLEGRPPAGAGVVLRDVVPVGRVVDDNVAVATAGTGSAAGGGRASGRPANGLFRIWFNSVRLDSVLRWESLRDVDEGRKDEMLLRFSSLG